MSDVETITLARAIAANLSSIAQSQKTLAGQRQTGFTAMTGTADKANTWDTSTITLGQLAQRVKALQDALTTAGIVSP
jgi:hypothetical protein